jgi:flagellar export protein FliJ
MNHRREDYLQANRQLKGVQRREEKARSRHRVESHRAEQAELDDFAGARTARRVLLT